MPDRVKLTTYDGIERTEICILDCQVVELKLDTHINQQTERHSSLTHLRIRPFQLRQCRIHTLHNRMVYILHALREWLVQLHHVRPPPSECVLHAFVETRVHVRATQLELFHHQFERVEPACERLGCVGEGLDEPSGVGLAEEADDEGFR